MKISKASKKKVTNKALRRKSVIRPKVVRASTAKRKVAPKRKAATKRKAAPKSVGSCFVMMPFEEPFNTYYGAIFKPAIIKANLEPIRADDLFRPSAIVSDMWEMIQDAKVLLAEMTTRNANVFYELGLAHAIGKPVVLVSETLDDVPFDLQQLRVQLYDKNDPAWGKKLAEDLTKALRETLAKPVEAVPSIFRKTVKSQAPEQDETQARLDALESEVRRARIPAGTAALAKRVAGLPPGVFSWFEAQKLAKTLRPLADECLHSPKSEESA